MRAGAGQSRRPHEPAHVSGGTARDAGDAGVAAGESSEQHGGLFAHVSVLGPLDDRGEHAVDAAEDGAPGRIAGQGLERLGERLCRRSGHRAVVCPAMSSRLALAAIATAAGAFSGLFGVGGGTIIVPLLVIWLGYGQKEATGTSLAAIIEIGALAAGGAGYGNVDFGKGLLIAVPAVAGVVAGTALQQRISEKAVAGAFVALLLASAAVLIF